MGPKGENIFIKKGARSGKGEERGHEIMAVPAALSHISVPAIDARELGINCISLYEGIVRDMQSRDRRMKRAIHDV